MTRVPRGPGLGWPGPEVAWAAPVAVYSTSASATAGLPGKVTAPAWFPLGTWGWGGLRVSVGASVKTPVGQRLLWRVLNGKSEQGPPRGSARDSLAESISVKEGIVGGSWCRVSRCHPTPQFMQKKSPLYMLLKEDTVWSMDHLNRYINDKFRKTKGLPRDWVFTAFTVCVPGGEARARGACGDGAVLTSSVICMVWAGLGAAGPESVSVWIRAWEPAVRGGLHLSLS